MKPDSSLSKGKCLFLWLDNKQFHAIEAAKHGIDVAQVYFQVPSILRIIRRIQIKLKLPFISLWISQWKKEIQNYDVIIIHASRITVPVVKYIKRRNPDVRIIVWYWNPVDKTVSSNAYPDSLCEKWSFDEEDSKKYGLSYNTQYYFNDIELPNNKIDYDVFFIGGDKGRIQNLVGIQEKLNNLGVSNYFHITPAGKLNETYREVYKKRIPYNKILDYISKSTAILDYVSEKQSGLTLRPLEALFFKKKLITNDITIMDRDFYTSENIFILGKDNLNNLSNFLDSPYRSIDETIINRYDFNNWLRRFFESEISKNPSEILRSGD